MSPVVDPEQMLPRVEKMIYSQAWKFAKAYPISFEEAKAEAYWAFMRACYSFDPNRGAIFPTWCFFKIWCGLKDIIMKRTADPHVCMADLLVGEHFEIARRRLEEDLEGRPQETDRFMEQVEDTTVGVSADAKELLNMVLSAPPELLGGKRPTSKQLMLRAKRFMVSKGLEADTVETAHLELETCFKESWK